MSGDRGRAETPGDGDHGAWLLTGEPPIERVRMAVAEIGYDPALVIDPESDGGAFRYPTSFPDEVMWRAREVALIGKPMCAECSRASSDFAAAHGRHPDPWLCLATRRFTQDCGQTDRTGEADG